MEAPQIEKNNVDNEEDEEADEEEEDEEGASTNGDKDEDEKTQFEGCDSSSISLISLFNISIYLMQCLWPKQIRVTASAGRNQESLLFHNFLHSSNDWNKL